jgi:hypothetical protein
VAALALACTFALAATGCGGSDGDSAAPTATVRRSSPTTGAPGTTSTTAAPGHEDFTAILRNLLARRDEAYEKNDVSILEDVYSAQCPCLANGRQVIEGRIAEGVHTAGERQRLHSVALVDRPSGSFVVLRAITEQGPNQLVRADGSVARAGETEPPTAYIVALTLEGFDWRVATVQVDPATGGKP